MYKSNYNFSRNSSMQMLNWNNDARIQEQGIKLARQVNQLDIFFQPMEFGSKEIWDNCAKILAETDDVLCHI